MNAQQLLQPPTKDDPRVEFELTYYALPWDDRMRPTFEHDRFPIREIYPTFEDAMERANDPEFDQIFDIMIHEHDPELGYIQSWEVK